MSVYPPTTYLLQYDFGEMTSHYKILSLFQTSTEQTFKMSAQFCVLSHIDAFTIFQPVKKDHEKTSCTFRLVITQFSTRRLAFISIRSTECQQTVKASTI